MKAEEKIRGILKDKTGIKKIELAIPPDSALGDYAFPCFEYAKSLGIKPNEAAQKIDEFKEEFISNADCADTKIEGPYYNFFVDISKEAEVVLSKINKEKDSYGHSGLGEGKTIVIDYSSPNIAKPFGIGHLRSTVIGNSLKNIYSALGYKVVGVNHLGDWGTQFGKLIVAYKEWGNEEELKKLPIIHLLNIYVKFHEEAEKRPELDDQAREWFKKLEAGEEEAASLWELFRELSLEEFKKYYQQLNVEFDSYHGESFYNDKMENAISKLGEKAKIEESDGAQVVKLKGEKPPFMVQKSDGASTYHTRDLAAALYRFKEYHPKKIIYVVGAEQKFHFTQLFEVLGMMDYTKEMLEHVSFGLIKFPEGKMSTRKGNIIFLEEVLDKATELALKTIKEKNPDLGNKDKVSRQIGVGAIIFGDLLNDRIKDVVFSWDKILDFEGETAPYLQYVHARSCSILRKYGQEINGPVDCLLYKEKEEKELIMRLGRFNSVIEDACKHNKPHIIAKYLMGIGQTFNSFYVKCPVISEDAKLTKARVLLVDSVRQVIKNGLGLLGVESPEEM